jgi:hypothetical protein
MRSSRDIPCLDLFSLVISVGVRGFTLEGCTWCMECPDPVLMYMMDMFVTGVWWWLPVRGGPHDIGGRCLLWPIKDHRGMMPGTRNYVKRARRRP